MTKPHRGDAARPAPAPTPGARGARAGALLVALALVTFLPTLRNGFIWDDDAYVTANPTLRSLGGLWRIWFEPGAVPQYYPLTFSTLWLDHQLGGTAAWGYHLVNVLLHACSVVLLWRVLTRLAVPGAWLGAALFAVHPVGVESVAWVAERKNVLSMALALTSGLTWLRWAGIGDPPARGWISYAGALVAFVGALLAKTVTCTLPGVLALLVWWRKGRVPMRDALALAPFVVLGGMLGAVTVWLEKTHVGASGVDWTLTALDRVVLAGRVACFYAASLVWPHPLVFNYPRWQVDARQAWQWAFPLLVAVTLGALWWRRATLGRGPLVAALVFVGVLGPALGFFDVFPMRYAFVADHFQYHAMPAVLALVAAALVRGLDSVRLRAGVVVLLGALVALSWRQSGAYRDEQTLWLDTLARNPRSWMAHNNLGLLYYQEGRIAEAIQQWEAALAARPDDAFAMNNLGNALASQARWEEAEARFRAALRIEPDNTQALNNLGNVLAVQQRLDDAAAVYAQVLALSPRWADPRGNLANVLAQQGRMDEAIAQYDEALRLDPAFADAHRNLGTVLLARGERDAAVSHLREAARLRPAWREAIEAQLAGLSPRD